MYHLPAADIDGDMIDGTVFAIEEQITRLRRRRLDPRAAVGLGFGGMGQADAVFLIDAQYKTGTVGALGQAGTAPDVRIADELLGVSHQRGTVVRNTGHFRQCCRLRKLQCQIHEFL